uniref:Uncharacterized protein n=1 Tax=Steinernema glaseri TaxID=37863 RepID=A0A1I7Y5G5_9BILA
MSPSASLDPFGLCNNDKSGLRDPYLFVFVDVAFLKVNFAVLGRALDFPDFQLSGAVSLISKKIFGTYRAKENAKYE